MMAEHQKGMAHHQWAWKLDCRMQAGHIVHEGVSASVLYILAARPDSCRTIFHKRAQITLTLDR